MQIYYILFKIYLKKNCSIQSIISNIEMVIAMIITDQFGLKIKTYKCI